MAFVISRGGQLPPLSFTPLATRKPLHIEAVCSREVVVRVRFVQYHRAVHDVRVPGVARAARVLLRHLHQDHVRRPAQRRPRAAALSRHLSGKYIAPLHQQFHIRISGRFFFMYKGTDNFCVLIFRIYMQLKYVPIVFVS